MELAAHLVKGRQLNDSDAASKSKDCSLAARPAVFKGRLCQLVGFLISLPDEMSFSSRCPWLDLPLPHKVRSRSDEEEGSHREHVRDGPN